MTNEDSGKTCCTLDYEAEYEKLKLHLEEIEQKARCLNEIVREKERELEIARAQLNMVYLIFGK